MKKILILSGLSLLAAFAVRAQDKVTEYNVRPAIVVRTPIQGDSINFTGEKFTADKLLKTDIDLDFDGRSYERVPVDTAGYVRVAKADKDNLFYLFATNLRAERFMKGKLNIYSPARFEVFVNGVSKQSKTTAEDSLSQVSPSVLGLRLEPEVDYEIVIKLLSVAADKTAPVLKCEFEKDKEFADVGYQIAPDLKRRFALHNTAFGSRVRSVSPFNSLSRAWTKVAAGSEEGYLLVRDVLDGLKSQYDEDLNREAWINRWIYHVEEARKQRIQERWSVTQVLQWLER